VAARSEGVTLVAGWELGSSLLVLVEPEPEVLAEPETDLLASLLLTQTVALVKYLVQMQVEWMHL